MNAADDIENEVTDAPPVAPSTRAGERRGRIIAAARTLFAENGFHNTGIAQIARQSGVLVGQIYRDFANKEEIVAEIVERDCAPLLAHGALAVAVEAQDADAVRAWIAVFIAGKAEHDPRLVAEIVAESARNDRIAAIFRSVQQRLQCSIMAALEMLDPTPAKQRRREVLADVILTISGGIFQRRMGRTEPIDPDLIEALTRAIYREIDVLQQG